MTFQFDLGGKTAVVTGASGGLGAHIAEVLARAGAHVIIGARRKAALDTLAEKIVSAGGSVEAVSLDVTSAASLNAVADSINTVDILVNNAGVTRECSLLEMSEEDWDCVQDTNAKGIFLMTQSVARIMKAAGRGGSIINVGSILGLRQGGMVASYAASKAAALQLTKVSALELARFGIRVNAIAPGYFKTDINADFFESAAGQAMISRIPQRRLGNKEDLDGALLLLASDASAYMTGSIIEVDGGHLVSTL